MTSTSSVSLDAMEDLLAQWLLGLPLMGRVLHTGQRLLRKQHLRSVVMPQDGLPG